MRFKDEKGWILNQPKITLEIWSRQTVTRTYRMTANIIILLCSIIIMIMSSESHEDEDLNRGEAVAQEQQRISEQTERPAKETQAKRKDPDDRGEAVAQEQQRISEEGKR